MSAGLARSLVHRAALLALAALVLGPPTAAGAQDAATADAAARDATPDAADDTAAAGTTTDADAGDAAAGDTAAAGETTDAAAGDTAADDAAADDATPDAATTDAAADDATPDADAAPAVPTVRVHVRARRPGVELHMRLGTHVVTTDGISRVADDYTLVCAPAPCDADVPAGVHLFGVSAPEGDALPARDVDLAAGLEHTLEIDLDDRSGWRTLGTLVALIVGIPGLVVLAVSLIGPTIEHSRYDAVFIATGAALTAVGIAALPLAAWGDTREVALVDPEATD